jgi:alginate O-acetyltransferase complex protein AlgI
MLFNSIEFIFVFLPLVLSIFLATANIFGARIGFTFLLLASFCFYAYWNPWHLPVLVTSLCFNYLVAQRVLAIREQNMRAAKWTAGIGIAINLSALVLFKYHSAASQVLDSALGSSVLNIALPIGISFYTFQQVAFLVDCLRENPIQLTPTRYALFLSFFPHLLAGPLTHHHEMLPQFQRVRANSADAGAGLSLFVFGLFKNVVIADNLA